MNSYHNHTTWSDGKSTVLEMVQAAGKLGLDEIGISDHLVITPFEGVDLAWSMQPDSLGEYVASVREVGQASAVSVRLGLEVDYFPETVDRARELLDEYSFDFLIGAVHFVDAFPIDESASYWREKDESQRDLICRRYWHRIRQMADTGLFSLAAHLDLYKKFGIVSGADLSAEIDSALDAVERSGIMVEFNTAGWDKPCAQAYPGEGILRKCAQRNIPVVITADAHSTEELIRHFSRAEQICRSAGARLMDTLGIAPSPAG